MLVAGESPSARPADIALTQDARLKRAMPSWRAGVPGSSSRRAGDETKHCRGGAGSALCPYLPTIANLRTSHRRRARHSRSGSFEIVAGEAARDRDFGIAEIESYEAAAATCVIFLVAERAALEPSEPGASREVRAAQGCNIPGRRCRKRRRRREKGWARCRARSRPAG